MKKLLFVLLIVAFYTSYSQEGAVRSIKTTSGSVILRDLSGEGNKIVGVSGNGLTKKITVDNTTIVLENDTLKSKMLIDNSTGTLSGTNVTWDYSVKKNNNITLTGNTVITLTNVPDGGSGTLYVTNAASTYTITFAGYVNSIDQYIRLASNMVITSGGGKYDDFTFKYNGTKLNWNGTLDRH